MYEGEYSGDFPKKSVKNSIRQPPTLNPNSLHTLKTKAKKSIVVVPYRSNRVYPEGISKAAATRKKKSIPFITILTILTQIGLLSWAIYSNRGVESFSDNPYYGPSQSVRCDCESLSSKVLISLGAKDSGRFYSDKEYYRVITPLFLHAGVFQIVITFLITAAIGWTMEREYNSFRYGLSIYCFC